MTRPNGRPNLAEQLRPKTLDEVVGHERLKLAIRNFISEECQHWLFYGPTGTGKTTLARIVAKDIQGPDADGEPEIYQWNAAEFGGVTEMREWVNETKRFSMHSKHRVTIFDEAHKLTKDAQSVLLTTFEENDCGVNVWILCTTEREGLLKPLRDRCPATFKLEEMGPQERRELVDRAATHLKYTGDLTRFLRKVESEKFSSARDILAAFERVCKGMPVDEAVEV